MKIKCLVLDHDDTTVSSTPCIHYPAFVKILEMLRPGMHFTMEDFLVFNIQPGLLSFYVDEMKFTPDEMKLEWEIWQQYVREITPDFFPGMPELIQRFTAAGGKIGVVSHSTPEFICRDYQAAGLPVPELIYGWNSDRSKCKPSPWPLQEIMRITGCGPEELLMVDDLKPGMDMAHACGVKFAACSWGYEVPAVREILEAGAEYSLRSVSDLEELLFAKECA